MAVVPHTVPARGAQAESVVSLGARVDAYLTDYEAKVSTLVADEVQVQRVEGPNHALLAFRRFESEVAFLRLPGDREWLGHRRIHAADGRPVRSRDPRGLTELFALGTLEARRVAGALVEDSARFNLGAARSVNVPTLPLELAHPRRRGSYDMQRGDMETIDGRPLARLELVERGRGGVVHYGPDRFFHTTVRLWVDDHGAVHRALAIMTPPERPRVDRGDPSVRVDFVWNAAVAMLVPSVMDETFLADEGLGKGQATYSGFRRFAVSARLLPG